MNTIYVSAIYFDTYHNDMDAVLQQVHELAKRLPQLTYVHLASDRSQVHIGWGLDAAPEHIGDYLDQALTGAEQLLCDLPPDMTSAIYQHGDRYHTLYRTWSEAQRAVRTVTRPDNAD